ncbi:MAG: histidine kinase [Rhizobiales bacterium PAR1]|nr:MAG: histidine kinase [Rhizobiales bacterium PAR1]
MLTSLFRTGLLAGVLALAPDLALAKTYTIPDPNPIAVVTLPDDWENTEIAKGVESTSEDDEIYLALEVVELEDVAKAVADTIKWLKGKGVTVDVATEKKGDITINGMTGVHVHWTGTDEDGPAQIGLTILAVTDKRGLILTYWGSPDGEKANLKELSAIADSLKPVK